MSIETTVLNLRSIQEEVQDYAQFEEILATFDLRFDEYSLLLKDAGVTTK